MTELLHRDVLQRVELADDQEIHVSLVTIAEETVVEVRHYTPSLNKYGRGLFMPHNARPLATLEIGIAKAAGRLYGN